MEEELKIDDLLEEVMYVYDNDIDAIAIHMSYIIDNMKKNDISFKRNNIPLSTIKNNLYNKKDLEKYRTVFIRIMDTLKGEIEEFKDISKLKFVGLSSVFYLMVDITNNEEVLNKINKKEITMKKKEIVNIIYYLQKILNNFENIEKIKKDKR